MTESELNCLKDWEKEAIRKSKEQFTFADFELFEDAYHDWKDSKYTEEGIRLAKTFFPTTRYYGGDYDNFDQVLDYCTKKHVDPHYSCLRLIERTREHIAKYASEEMIEYLHNAVISYSRFLPDDPIFQKILEKYNW